MLKRSMNSMAPLRLGLTVLAVTSAAALLWASSVAATEAISASTGKACVYCHQSAAGGALNETGTAFKANGDKLPGAAKSLTQSLKPWLVTG